MCAVQRLSNQSLASSQKEKVQGHWAKVASWPVLPYAPLPHFLPPAPAI